MKNSVKSNMYERTLEGIWEVFGEYLRGEYQALICVLSASALSEPATTALQNTFARLGYGKAACTFFSLSGHGVESNKVANLAVEEFYTVVEGLDPLIVVVTDEETRSLCAQAYRQEIPLAQRWRILGRDVRAFASFEKKLADEQGKKEAWALLRTFPKYEA